MCCFFFFKQKTAYEMRISGWSSDVCSSDLARRVGDFLAAHIDDLIHARAEFRAVGILSDEIADEAIDLFVQLRPFFIINGDKARGPFLCHWCYRLRRGQDQAFFLHLSRTRRHIWSPSRQ